MEADKTLIPSEVILEDSTEFSSIVKLRYNPDSPFEFIYEDDHFFIIDTDDEGLKAVKVKLVHENKALSTSVNIEGASQEILVSNYVGLLGLDRISIIPFDGCWNWSSGHPCKFCNLALGQGKSLSYWPTLNDISSFGFDVKSWWEKCSSNYFACLDAALEAFVKNLTIHPHTHLLFMSGNLPDNTLVWKILQDVISITSKYFDFSLCDTYINCSPHNTLDELNQVKKKGISQVQYNLEVIGKENYESICPGKMKYSKMRSKLIEAVSVMGKGKVRTNFVFGLQPADELLEGVEELASQGIVSDYSVFQPKSGTPFANKKAPSMDEVVRFTESLIEIYKKHGFKPIYCSLSSRSSIINEIMYGRLNG